MNIKDVYKYLDAKYPKDFPILKPKIDEFYQQGIKPDRIYNLMSQYIDLKPYCRALDVQNGDIIEFVKAVKIGTFLRAKFNNEETFSIMQKTLVFEDNNICIFKPTNFQESSVIGEPICCFAYSQGRWDEHYNGYQEAIYYVYDVMKEGTQHDFVSITVRPNGRALVLDKEHNWWSKQQSIQYIQSLEEGASYITTKDRKTIKTENKKYKTNTNMAKKQVIRLTEGDLHRIIKESVNNVLTELNWKTYASAAKKARELGRDSRWDFDRATERALKGEYGEDVGVATDNDTYQRFRGYSNYPNIKDAWIPLEGHEDFGAYSDFPTNKEMGKDISDYVHGRSEYIKGKGWAKK